jgi:hypothetical protein
MKRWIAHLIQPKMCGIKLERVMSYRAPDTWDGEKIVSGSEFSSWRTCGRPLNHLGDHGSWSLWFMYRTRLANWLDP